MNETITYKDVPRVHLRAFARLTKIHRAIAAGNYPNIATLSEICATGIRTVKRDLVVLRDEFNAPLKYDARRKGYFFTVQGWALPLQRITEGDLLAFFIAENSLKFTGHTPEALKLKTALSKIASILPEEVSINLAALGENASFQNLPFAAANPATLQTVAFSAISQQVIEFDYFSPHSQKSSHRVVSVHLLHNFAGDWFAVSFDHEKEDFRDFHVGRMKNLKTVEKQFQRQNGWRAEDYLKKGFSMMRGGRLTEVEIIFNRFRAQWIRERAFFHPEETREDLPDGGLRLKFKIGEKGLEAVARFCLSYAGDCRAVKPLKLREIITEKLQIALSQYKN